MSQSSFTETIGKKIVREKWNTPFLRYLHEKHGIRYRYMGFPGSKLTDIILWQDMIDEVIAFELPADGDDDRLWIRELRTNLRKLGIPGTAYFGSFEEVVILRQDFDGQSYKQDEIITLYNLDFCDEISSKIETAEFGEKLWRFEALRIILKDQKDCYREFGGSSQFIILLTIRNQIEGARINGFLQQNLYSDTEAYRSACEKINPIPQAGPLIGTHAWALKAFLCNTLKSYFSIPNISALFFPFVKYHGTPIRIGPKKYLRSPMLHWMILCKFAEDETHTPRFYPENFLEFAISLSVGQEKSIVPDPEPGELSGSNGNSSSINWLGHYEDVFF